MKRTLILFMMVNVLTISQGVEVVKGKVMNRTSNAPIADVHVKSTMGNVFTNSLGEFSILVENLNEKLKFSKSGYGTIVHWLKGKMFVGKVFMLEDPAKDSVNMVTTMVYEIHEMEMNSSAVMPKKMELHSRGIVNCSSPYLPLEQEEYSGRTENGFHETLSSPLSTFSIDVDNAGYSNVRRFLNNGMLPPIETVKVEEMVNYFQYHYSAPLREKPFAVEQNLVQCPWNRKHQILRLGLQTRKIDKEELPYSNMVFLVDVSGSMQAQNKLPLVKSSLKMLVQELRSEDIVSMVSYAGSACVVLNPTSGHSKMKILQAIDKLSASGSTAGGDGIDMAYSLAEKNIVVGGNNRIIMATDGDFNVGPSSTNDLKNKVIEYRKKGIYISVLGYGMGNYKDNMMEAIAQNGNGNHAYIDNLQEAKKVLINEMGANLFTVAKDVKIQIEFNPNVAAAYRLVGYENRLLQNEDFNDDKVDAGEVGLGHQVTALYEIVPAKGENGFRPLVDPLKYGGKGKKGMIFNQEVGTLKIRYKHPNNNTSEKMEVVISNENKASNGSDIKFASSVALFGMLLSQSEYVQEGNFEMVIEWAKEGLLEDQQGYRAEFVRLAEIAQSLSQLSQVRE